MAETPEIKTRPVVPAGETWDSHVFEGPDAEEARAILAELDVIAGAYEMWKKAKARRLELWSRGLELGITSRRMARHSKISPVTLTTTMKRIREREDAQ